MFGPSYLSPQSLVIVGVQRVYVVESERHALDCHSCW